MKRNTKEIAHTPEGVLVRLKEKIRIALNLDISNLKVLIDRFVMNNAHGETSSKVHFAKVNIYNELSKPKMTIKVFFKFLKIIKIQNVRITISVTTPKGKEITVTEEMSLFKTDLGENDLEDTDEK